MENIIEYKQYLHDEWEEIDYMIQYQKGIDITEKQREKLGRPFYEVCLDITINLDTGKVIVTHFQGVELVHPVTL